MRKSQAVFYCFVAALSFTVFASTASAADKALRKQCRKAFREQVRTCVHSARELPPRDRGDVKRACVRQARQDRKTCLLGEPDNACETACQTTYESDVQICYIAYDPIASCGDDLACQELVLEQRNDCIDSYVFELNRCIGACQQ